MLRIRVLGSGSTGNATLIESDGTRILLDVGVGPRELAKRLAACDVEPDSIALAFLSHEHGDHSRGARSFSRRHGVPIAATRGTLAALGLDEDDADLAGCEEIVGGEPFGVGNLTVIGVPIPHDAAEPLAFVISNGSAKLGHATDLGHLERGVTEAFRCCDALLIESNYDTAMLRDGPYPWSLKQRIQSPWGHLSNDDVARYLRHELGPSCRQVLLAHLSRTNNHPEVALMAAEAALRARGDVDLTLCDPKGTGWIEVHESPSQQPRGQLSLFS